MRSWLKLGLAPLMAPISLHWSLWDANLIEVCKHPSVTALWIRCFHFHFLQLSLDKLNILPFNASNITSLKPTGCKPHWSLHITRCSRASKCHSTMNNVFSLSLFTSWTFYLLLAQNFTLLNPAEWKPHWSLHVTSCLQAFKCQSTMNLIR